MDIKPALRPYVPLAQMLVQTFGADCEIVLHDLDVRHTRSSTWKTRP